MDYTTIRYLQHIAQELYDSKCKEVQRLQERVQGPPSWIGIRQKEEAKLKELAEGLTLVELPDPLRVQTYLRLDKKLQLLTKQHPDLKGHILILGPDKKEFLPYYSRICLNLPMTFFRS